MAAKGMMATDIKGSEDEDVAGGKHVDGIDHLLEKGRKRNKTLIIVSRLRRGNIKTWQQREIDNGVRNGDARASPEQWLWSSCVWETKGGGGGSSLRVPQRVPQQWRQAVRLQATPSFSARRTRPRVQTAPAVGPP